MNLLESLHFTRPLWLTALFMVPLVLWLMYRLQQHRGHWHRFIDQTLLQHLAQPSGASGSSWQFPLLALILSLIIVAGAGPSWEQQAAPVMKSEAATVYVVDLSPSMLAEDLKPSRLVRARQKLSDALAADKEGLKALIVYAGEAHLVTPLTDDARTIQSLVPSLSPRIMPLTGSNIEMALELATRTLSDSHIQNGQILLFTDGITSDSLGTAKAILAQTPYPLFIIGLGNETGAPIPLGQQGFAKTANGEVVIARNERALLHDLSGSTGGDYRDIALDDSDLIYLQRKHQNPGVQARQVEREFDQWIDRGHWLVWLALPLVLIAFRHRTLLSLLFGCIVLPFVTSPPAQADQFDLAKTEPVTWQSLWLNGDQRGARALENNDPSAAVRAFTDPRWKAYAQYQAGDFSGANNTWNSHPPTSASDWYNLGNTQAQAGALDDAIASYEQALTIDPSLEDARYNKQLVEEAREQKKQQEQSQGQSKDQSQEQQKQDQQQQDQQNQAQSDDSGDGQSSSSSKENPADSDNGPNSGQDQEKSADQQTAQSPDETGNAGDSSNDQGDLDARRGNQPNTDEQPGQSQGSSETAAGDAPEQDQTPEQAAALTGEATDQDAAIDAFSELSDEQRQAAEQWLNRIEDDPSNLLKRKFEYQYRQRKQAIRNDEWTAPENNAHERW